MITCGGVSLRELILYMVLKRLKISFAGEILDLDGPSGGYNLQECWSTGFLAGESAARRSKAN